MKEIKPMEEMTDEEILEELARLRARREQRRVGAKTRTNGNAERTAPRGGGRKRQIETLDIDDDVDLVDVNEEVSES